MTARRHVSTRRTTTATSAARLRRAGRLASSLRRLAQLLAEDAVTLETEIGLLHLAGVAGAAGVTGAADAGDAARSARVRSGRS